jgi:hypothetical protein
MTSHSNRSDNSSSDDRCGGDMGWVAGGSAAVVHAEAGAQAWRAAARVQRSARAGHSDFYAIAGCLVETVQAVHDLAQVLAAQVRGYAAGLPSELQVYDDTRTFSPQQRLEQAAIELEAVAAHLGQAAFRGNGFWSAIGHIGVEVRR